MTDLSDVRANIADQLTRTDLSTQIDREIQNAIREYNRSSLYVTELRNGSITTVANQTWYDTIDFTSASGYLSFTAASSIQDVLKVTYARLDLSGIDEPLTELGYGSFERYLEGTSTTGVPDYWTTYAGQFGLWPIPGQVYTVYVSAVVKGIVPSADSDESAWFDQAQELIEACASKKVCLKYLHDTERAQAFAALEIDQRNALAAEHTRKTATGRLTPTWF